MVEQKQPKKKAKYLESDAATLAHEAALAAETLRRAALSQVAIEADDLLVLKELLRHIKDSAETAYRIMHYRNPNRRIIAAAVTDPGRKPLSHRS